MTGRHRWLDLGVRRANLSNPRECPVDACPQSSAGARGATTTGVAEVRAEAVMPPDSAPAAVRAQRSAARAGALVAGRSRL